MKKLLSWLLALSMMLPMCVTASAEDSTEWAPTATSYTADFTNANELSKWKLVKGTANESISNGVLNWGSNDAAYILPIAAMSDVLVEVDLTHTGGNTSFDIAFGLDENGSNINNNRMYFISKPGARTLLKYAGTTTVSRYAGDNNGYQWNINRYLEGGVVSDYYQSMKFKLVIYNKRLAAWANDQLVYTYTLDDAYTGGYVALSPRTYRSIIRSVTARAATASDMVFAESFNEATDSGSLTNIVLAGGSSGKLTTNKYGTATMSKPGGTTFYADTNKKAIGNHVYSAGFTFDSSSTNGATSWINPTFGIVDNDDGSKSLYSVFVRWNGEINIQKATFANSAFTWSNLKTFSKTNTIAKFPDKLGTYVKNETTYDVLKPNVMWEYKHILNDGTISIYLDNVLIGSYSNDELKEANGYTGFVANGIKSLFYYLGVRGIEANIDLNRPNQVKIRVADVNGLVDEIGDKIVRFYTTETTTDETTNETTTTETLYGTAYADANGLFDLALGHNQKYVAKLYDSATATTPTSTTNVTYKAGQQLVIDFPIDANFSTLADIDFAENAAADNSTNANPITFVGDAKTEEVKAFGTKEALILDGIGDGARITNKAAFDLKDTQKLTVEAVFMPEERDGIKTMAVVGGAPLYGAGKQGGYGLYVDQNSAGEDIIAFRIYVVNGEKTVLHEVTAECEMNKAYYAAATYDGENMKLYVNGELEATKALTGDIYSISTVTPGIGAEWYYLNNQVKHFFKGAIADVEVTNGVKDENAVIAKFEEYAGTYGYALEGEEFVDDITAKVSFDNAEPDKGDVVTASVAVRNASSEAKTVSVKMVPGYFAALTNGTDTKELTVEANSTATATFIYKLLEGGREPFKAYVFENNAQVAYDVESLSVNGAGYYKGDIHNHSTRSDGVNTFEENLVEGFFTKNLSYSYSTEHHQYNASHVNKAANATAGFKPGQFIVLPGSEFTTDYGHANAYALDNDVTNPEEIPFWNESKVNSNNAVSTNGWQYVIDTVEKDYGGVMYLNHTADPTYFIKDEIVEQLRGFTGYEVWNGAASAFAQMTLSQRDTWDKINSLGWGHVIGQASTDAHGSVMFGTIQKVSYMSEISKDEINRSMEDGNAIGTNGPEIRFDINGVAMNDTAVITGTKANFNIDVYDPMGDILEVKLIKNKVSKAFTIDNREEIELYKKADGAEAISTWKYSEARDVADGEFYRVEVTTAQNPYGSMDSKGIKMTDEGAGQGWAFTNNIWISGGETSNSTNISSIAYDGDSVEVAELPTGIKYLKGSGNFVLKKLSVVADGTVEKKIENDLVTITVTAPDSSVSKTELYLVGDITVVEAETTLSATAEVYTTEALIAIQVVDDAEVLKNASAKAVCAIYNGNTLIGVGSADVNSVESAAQFVISYPEQEDLTNVTAKAMLWRDMSNITPLCKPVNVELIKYND